VQTISAKDFWSDTLPKDSPYYRFRESYRPVEESQTCSCVQNISSQELIFKKDEYGPYAYPETTQKVYEKFTFPFKENHFMILTGFSGCGKSTFCNQLVEKEISRKDKYKFRYFPARSQESLASGSQICVEEDLQSIYQFYNEISNIHDPKTANKIIEHFRAVQLFKKENDMSYYEAFLKKPLYSLSGGELQRYWFARITFMYGIPEDQKPKLLIFDESISSLDCMTKDTLLHFIVTELFEKEHLSILFVTHDLRDIGVLHNILAQQKKAELFQHFELFDKRMFQVRTPYFTYKDNAVSGAFNEYEETSTGERYTYRIKGGG
jgi:ABC-type dipeptide/oligopeptide/nickel transport system ATPase subunit